MTTLNLQVGASTDDARVYDYGVPDGIWDTIDLISQYHIVGRVGGAAYGVGDRFLNVTIGQGDTIVSASMVFTCRFEQTTTTVRTNLDGEDIDDAATFTDCDDYNNRVRTDALVPWDSIGTWLLDAEYTSPELKTVIQEIVDRVGWASGNALAMFWEDDTSDADVYRAPYSWDGNSAKADQLDIDYTAANVTVNAEPAAADAVALLPTIVTANVVVDGEVAEATAAAPLPTIAAQRQVTISAEVAEAPAAALAPTITTIWNVLALAVSAVADAVIPAPTVITGEEDITPVVPGSAFAVGAVGLPQAIAKAERTVEGEAETDRPPVSGKAR